MNRPLHRLHRTDSLDWVRGRDAVASSDLRDSTQLASCDAQDIEIDRLKVTTFTSPTAQWSRHLWSRLELGSVAAQTLVEDRGGRCLALGQDVQQVADALAANFHPYRPLGELHAGGGQLGAGPGATLPLGLPSAIAPLADAMHRVWNGRDPSQLSAYWAKDVAWSGPDGLTGNRSGLGEWIAGLLGRCHDCVMLFEDAVIAGDRAAVQWRFHGDYIVDRGAAASTRVRLIGSTAVRYAAGLVFEVQTLIDTLALAVQLRAPVVEP